MSAPPPGAESRARLSARQLELLDAWLPGARIIADHSWGLVPTVVLEVESADGERFALKAAGPEDHHILREIEGHRRWAGPWRERGAIGELRAADAEARMLLTAWMPGDLVLDLPSARFDPEVHRQTGALLALLHAQESVADESWPLREAATALRRLDDPRHRIPAVQVERLRTEIATWVERPVRLVPTHGDYHPRNWLLRRGAVRIIDLGRAAMRPAAEDIGRLATGEFREEPELEAAFFAGYGEDPRAADPLTARQVAVGAAIGTAVWARQVGDEPFEQQGLRMVTELLDEPGAQG